MRHDVQVAIARELLHHLETGSTARCRETAAEQASSYCSAKALAREKEHIFLAEPMVAALSCEIPEPADYIAEDSVGVPYILWRGRDGRVRGFLNGCRHRGTRLLAEGRGNSPRVSCPFHAWTYDAHGALAAMPHAGSFGAPDTSRKALIELPVAERHGLIWICLRPGGAIDPDTRLGGLADEIAGWALAGKHVLQTQALHRNMNWKLANDTFGETYHFAILHRNTLSAHYFSNISSYQTFDRNHRMVFAARTIDELRALPVSAWQLRPHATIAYYLYPNAQLLIGPGSVALYRLLPDAGRPDRCVIRQSLFLDRMPDDEAGEALRQRTLKIHEEVIVNEDFAVAESAQAALSSELLPEVVFGCNEPALHHYHSAFRAARAGVGSSD